MNRIIVTAWILSLFFVFAPDSSGVSISYEGPIEGLVFDLSPGLPASLPGIGEFTVTYAEVEVSGREHIVITPSGRYNYHANFGAGVIYVTTVEYGMIPVEVESGTLNEHFTIEGEIPDDPLDVVVPDDVDLYFKVNLVTYDGIVRFELKIKHGQIQFVRL